MSTEPATADTKLPTPPARRTWLTLLLALLVFVAGFVSGGMVTVVVGIHRLQDALHHPETAPARISKLLQHRLHLTDDQRAKVQAIIAERQTKLMAVRRVFQPQITSELDKLRNEIGGVLTDEQRDRWNQLFNTLVDRWMPPIPAEPSQPPASEPPAS